MERKTDVEDAKENENVPEGAGKIEDGGDRRRESLLRINHGVRQTREELFADEPHELFGFTD
jgi:hypothetical protein